MARRVQGGCKTPSSVSRASRRGVRGFERGSWTAGRRRGNVGSGEGGAQVGRPCEESRLLRRVKVGHVVCGLPAYSAGGSARSAVRRAAAAEDSPTSSIPCSGAGVKRADRVSARTSQTHTLLPDGISKSAHPRQSSGTLYRYTEVTFQLHVLTGFEP